MKPKIYFADLTHTAQGISAATFPLGISFVVAYAKQELGGEYELSLYKMPHDLERALKEAEPFILAFSNYSWNFELSCKMAALAKAKYPNLTVVMGGPNFPTTEEEQLAFMQERRQIDFYIQLEGEIGFVDLVRKLEESNLDRDAFKAAGRTAANTSYLAGDTLVNGKVERIRDVNVIPSPYLTGILDPFFDLPLVPMIETTRGCPFTCTFCADGLKSKSKIARFDHERTKAELDYIADRIRNIDELVITDLNFAMYKEDLVTARYVADLRAKRNWPVLLSASAGKNMPHRTIEVAGIMNGAWTLGASIQSTDPEVLVAIKRSNISSDAYQELIDYGNKIKTSKTHSEVILGLPADTKEKHFTSLRFGVENRVNSLRMFQAMLLRGTEMAAPETRAQYGLQTRFRVIPGCVGMYEFFGETYPVSEIEEIIVGSSSLSFDDYLECRVMNLIVETFYNNALFEEVYGMLHAIGVSPFDSLLYIKTHPELYTPRVNEIIDEFKRQTTVDLFDTFEEAQSYVLTPDIIGKYIGGELGINELLVHRALLYTEFEQSCRLFYESVRGALEEAGALTEKVACYLSELERFTLLRKRNAITQTDFSGEGEFHYDFQEIADNFYRYNPNENERSRTPMRFHFFHTPYQRQHIANQLKVYSESPIGLGKFIQRSNMKIVYRSFEKSRAADYPVEAAA